MVEKVMVAAGGWGGRERDRLPALCMRGRVVPVMVETAGLVV